MTKSNLVLIMETKFNFFSKYNRYSIFMITNKLNKVLSILCLTLILCLGVVATTSQALTIYPIDYTFTGFGKPGTTASIDIADNSTPAVTATFDGIVKADGTYSIPAKIATKDGTIAIKVETDEALDATIMFYDLTGLDTNPGFVIAPAIFIGSGATPNATVKVELPDGSSFIEKADAAGNFKTPISNVQLPGNIIVSELDANGLVIGTPKTSLYEGGIEVVSASQIATKLTPPDYITTPVVVTPPVVTTTPTTVTPTAVTPAKTVTVRTGGITDNFGIASIVVVGFGILFVTGKTLAKRRK
jgi:hypothetical protein